MGLQWGPKKEDFIEVSALKYNIKHLRTKEKTSVSLIASRFYLTASDNFRLASPAMASWNLIAFLSTCIFVKSSKTKHCTQVFISLQIHDPL